MNHIAIENLLMDRCTDSFFCFAIACENCGEKWFSTPIRFSKAESIPESANKKLIFKIIYEKEKSCARQNAIREAKKVFNLCPICKRIICDYCFLICDDLDMCKSCATRLLEKGEPVEQ